MHVNSLSTLNFKIATNVNKVSCFCNTVNVRRATQGLIVCIHNEKKLLTFIS